ncbi:glycoprotein Xg [Centrocercus urophasianus]|uniref:glycoprotein Xg n=1 Tax=Centrocercus urophasianus TaxID=9002 RepID=UPI001C65147E|nr:glycoprotein Xg [Centrocercus urophasianus]
MGKFRSIFLVFLGYLLVHVRGQRDFDLADALDHPDDIITRKPTVIRRPTRPLMNNDLHLGDALGGGDIPRQPLYPPLPPRPGSHSNTGGFNDFDLVDGKPLPPHIAGEEGHNFNHGGSTDSGLIAGVTSPIISAFVILVVGSIAAYTAYKNNKLCFKPRETTEKSLASNCPRSPFSFLAHGQPAVHYDSHRPGRGERRARLWGNDERAQRHISSRRAVRRRHSATATSGGQREAQVGGRCGAPRSSGPRRERLPRVKTGEGRVVPTLPLMPVFRPCAQESARA